MDSTDENNDQKINIYMYIFTYKQIFPLHFFSLAPEHSQNGRHIHLIKFYSLDSYIDVLRAC